MIELNRSLWLTKIRLTSTSCDKQRTLIIKHPRHLLIQLEVSGSLRKSSLHFSTSHKHNYPLLPYYLTPLHRKKKPTTWIYSGKIAENSIKIDHEHYICFISSSVVSQSKVKIPDKRMYFSEITLITNVLGRVYVSNHSMRLGFSYIWEKASRWYLSI